MDSFQAIIGCKMMRNRENKNYPSVSFLPERNRKFQKNRKKLKKLKNTITNSFQAKIGWKRIGKRENKKLSFRSVLFLPVA